MSADAAPVPVPAAPSLDSRRTLADVRGWWRVVRPPPSLGTRADRVYMIAITGGILGALAYGTASATLAGWITPTTAPIWGPSLVLLAMLAGARWGSVQGPVIFSVPDVGHLLGAPLPRRAMAAPRLLRALAIGAGLGILIAAVGLVGLAGDGRGVDWGETLAVAAGAALCGMLAVAAAAAVQVSRRVDRLTRLAIWPVLAAAAALVVFAHRSATGEAVALWSGPWGWTIRPIPGPTTAAVAALVALAALTALAAADALRRCGDTPTERHARRAEARAGAVASLWSMDTRTARLGLRAASDRAGHARPARGLRLPRSPALVIPWRDAVALRAALPRLAEGAALSAAGAALWLLASGRPAAGAAGALVAYIGAGRLLEPLRTEVDVPSRTRIMLRQPYGRVLLDHTLVPTIVVAIASALVAAGVAIAGALPDSGGGVALLTVVAAPTVTLCAALAARRGGRLPQSVLSTATAGGEAGAGIVIAYLAAWPAAAAILGGVPAILVAHSGSKLLPIAVIVAVIAPIILGAVLAASTPKA